MSTNPSDYILPPMDLPDGWKFAIDESGRMYYYHVKIRIPQWEPPIKLLPLMKEETKSVSIKVETVDNENTSLAAAASESEDEASQASSTDTEDSSEDELVAKLESIKNNIKLKKSNFGK